jgi:hypothetical protein
VDTFLFSMSSLLKIVVKILIGVCSDDITLSTFFDFVSFLLEAMLTMSMCSLTVQQLDYEFTFVFCKFVCVLFVISVALLLHFCSLFV